MNNSHAYKYKGFAVTIQTKENLIGWGAMFTVHSTVDGQLRHEILPPELQEMADALYAVPDMAIADGEDRINQWIDARLVGANQ